MALIIPLRGQTFTRTVTVAGKPKTIVFDKSNPVEVTEAELEQLQRKDIGVSLAIVNAPPAAAPKAPPAQRRRRATTTPLPAAKEDDD